MAALEVAMSRSPNILVLMSDQHRADMMGCAGDPAVKTPVMDRLAAEGVRFSRAICQGPLCMPARASLLTERYVRDHGVFQNNSEVDLELPTGVQSLREAGYHTAVIGKTHLWAHGDRGRIPVSEMRDRLVHYGFDEVHETVGKLANLAHRNPYTEYLDSAGLLDEYRRHVGERTYGSLKSDEQPRERRPMWDATPIGLPVPRHYEYSCGSTEFFRSLGLRLSFARCLSSSHWFSRLSLPLSRIAQISSPRILPCVTNSRASFTENLDPSFGLLTEPSGCCSPASGVSGRKLWPWLNQPPSWLGIARASNSSGDGKVGSVVLVDLVFPWKFAG
jgi:hypothetical protein